MSIAGDNVRGGDEPAAPATPSVEHGGEADAMALVIAHEGRIEKLEAERDAALRSLEALHVGTRRQLDEMRHLVEKADCDRDAALARLADTPENVERLATWLAYRYFDPEATWEVDAVAILAALRGEGWER